MFKAIALLIPQANDRISSQIKQRSPISSDTLNIQSDRPSHSTNQRSQLTSNQITIAYFLRHSKPSKRSHSHLTKGVIKSEMGEIK